MNRYVLALASFLSLPLFAAPPASLTVTAAQRDALGIQVAEAVPADSYPTAALAAQVVAARDAQWQVTTPMAGQIRQVQPVGTSLAAGDIVAVVASAPLMQLGSDYVEAQNRVDEATAARVRAEALYADGSVAKKDRDQAVRDERMAIAQSEALQNRFRLLNIPPEQAISGELLIAAPFAGRVSAVRAVTGSSVDAAMPVVEIINPDALELEVHWPLSRGTVPMVGSQFNTADGVASRVIAEAPMSADGRQAVMLRLALVESAPQLRPGQWLWLHPQEQAPVVAVDRNAVIRNGAEAVVFTETVEGFAVTPVTVHGEDGGTRYVSGDIPPGTRVAISGVIALKGLWLGHGGE